MSHSQSEYGLITIGNAMVDVIAKADETYIQQQDKDFGMKKGSMNLVDAGRALTLYGDMKDPIQMSGGSAGNTMACFCSFGGKGAYIGKVADDALGKVFIDSLKDIGVDYETTLLEEGPSTGRCMILVTPDGERTMNTYLGAANELTPKDIDEEFIARGKVVYLEGYLYDPPKAMEAFVKAARIAHESGRQVSLTLSDSFCVDRHRESFKDLVSHHVDILFANEDEIISLYEVKTLDEALDKVQHDCALVAVTRSEKGSVIIDSGRRINIDAVPVEQAVDTTGAGDAYAAGFLFGYTNGDDLKTCGHYGSVAASHIISQIGPRPSVPLSDLIKDKQAA
ncbi:MAG: adenosine kinase [Pseudomonadota bacterium]